MTLLEKIIETDDKELTPKEKVIKAILNDITGRKGIGDEFDSIDDEIQDEIIDRWMEILNKHL